jgi:hypothetical protein
MIMDKCQLDLANSTSQICDICGEQRPFFVCSFPNQIRLLVVCIKCIQLEEMHRRLRDDRF